MTIFLRARHGRARINGVTWLGEHNAPATPTTPCFRRERGAILAAKHQCRKGAELRSTNLVWPPLLRKLDRIDPSYKT